MLFFIFHEHIHLGFGSKSGTYFTISSICEFHQNKLPDPQLVRLLPKFLDWIQKKKKKNPIFLKGH